MSGSPWANEVHSLAAPGILLSVGGVLTITPGFTTYSVLQGDPFTIAVINKGPANVAAKVGDVLVFVTGPANFSPSGTLILPFGQNVTMASANDTVTFRYDGVAWVLISKSILQESESSIVLDAGGNATILGPVHFVHSFVPGAPDNLDGITTILGAGFEGQVVTLQRSSAVGEDITVRDFSVSGNNIRTPNKLALMLHDLRDQVTFQYRNVDGLGFSWDVVAYTIADRSTGGDATVATSGTPVGPTQVRCSQVTISTADIIALGAVMAGDIPLGVMIPAGTLVLDGKVSLREAIAGGGVTTFTASLGTAATPTAIRGNTADLDGAAPLGTYLGARGVGIGADAPLQLVAHLISDVNFSTLTAGRLDITIIGTDTSDIS